MNALIQIGQAVAPAATPPSVYRFRSSRGTHVLAVDGSRVYDIPPSLEPSLDELVESGYFDAPGFGLDEIAAAPRITSLSLAVSDSCNLGCGYCYADGGDFGRGGGRMSIATARRAVDLLLRDATAGDRVLLGFMGGEPLTNRPVLRDAVRYAAELASRRSVRIAFSVTTNGTLIDREDARLFSEHDWTVQFSIDGTKEMHDQQRPGKNGRSSYDAAISALNVLREFGRPRSLTAKATIGHGWPALPDLLDHLVSLRFDDVGFSPVLASREANWALDADDLARFLDEMIACGERAVCRWKEGAVYPFFNLTEALAHIHRGTHQPYPCGAAGPYLAASGTGGLYACHRFAGDPRALMGDVVAGPDQSARTKFLVERHVDRQQPCRQCWARYLCGGGCHHEVLARGRHACDYIRGWLDFCLKTYAEVGEEVFA